MSDHKALIAEARSWIAEPLPARGDVVPAALFVTLVGRLADALEAATVERAVVEVQALEQAADDLEAGDWARRWLRARAVEIREGRQ